MPKNKKMPKNRILLCACKKYLRFQKNGILLLSFKDDNIDNFDIPINYKFYCTNNFEVFCFCPISTFKDIQILEIKTDKKDTNYFLVGGFDSIKKKGIIKLYKFIYDENFNKNRIEFIQDIIFDKKNYIRFNGPISCITQSNIDGKILITCWDGNIYLLEINDISYYIEYDNQVNNKDSFNKFFV